VTLTLVGLSHHVAPVELRERVTLDLPGAALLAHELGDAVCLSTCNRTELYVAGEDEAPAIAALERLAGESLDGIAVLEQCSVGTVKSRLFNGLERLARMRKLKEFREDLQQGTQQ